MKSTVLYFMLFITTWSQAQYRVSQNIDSLKNESITASDIASKFRATIQVAILYTYANPDSTIWYGELALRLAQEMNDVNNEIWALATIGEAQIYKGNLPRTVELAISAIEKVSLQPTDNQDWFIGPTYYNLSVTYFEIQDYDKAKFYARKTIEVGGDNGNDELGAAFGHYLMAMVFERLEMPEVRMRLR